MEFDHILLIGYGGPRTSEEVMPFLKGMMQGRNIPEEVLRAVAQNYERIGGASPYHDEVMRFTGQFEQTLKNSGIKLPVFVGMKNWYPFLEEVLLKIQGQGLRKGLAIILNAFPGAISGARYLESLQTARASLKGDGPDYKIIKGWHTHKLFIEAQAEEVSRLLEEIPEKERQETPILFSFHSLPEKKEGELSSYLEEAREAVALVEKRVGHAKGPVVFQSRPAKAQGSWLGPDIGQKIKELAQQGEKRVVIVPLGFFCDHVEILYDLDQRTREISEQAGIRYLRTQTVIHHPKIRELFLKIIRDAGALSE